MKLYQTQSGVVVQHGESFSSLAMSLDELIRRDDLPEYIRTKLDDLEPTSNPPTPRAPIGSQEVWAAGVTYYRSRNARMEESEDAGGGSFYDRVYSAPRPEVFFKATPHRVVGPGQKVRIRADSKWNVPEPELALVISRGGKIIGYTIGNDMSSRDIEGENPLYLPQAKVYDGCCALGPAILLADEPLAVSTKISIKIARRGQACFEDSTTLAQMKRSPQELVECLYRECSFPNGCILLTGTGIVPPNSFTLEPDDVIEIAIEGIGTLANVVERKRELK
jgi:2-dehydro-3-deoxy-D-arabinonate dehydratase